jgi:hypothetical protein
VVVGGDYNSVKLLKVEEVDLIEDGSGLRIQCILSNSFWSTLSHCSSNVGRSGGQ